MRPDEPKGETPVKNARAKRSAQQTATSRPRKIKNAVGRPSLYKRQYCNQVVTFCADGWSLASFAAEIGVARSTIQQWAADHAEFSVALSRAKAAAAKWWEGKARRVAESGGGPGTASVVIFALRNFAQDDYRDKREPAMKVALPALPRAIRPRALLPEQRHPAAADDPGSNPATGERHDRRRHDAHPGRPPAHPLECASDQRPP